MSQLLRLTALTFAATLALPALAQKPPAPGGGACTLEYQRADNMWAAAGRPDGPLGTETVTVQPGQARVFVTDWKYEKRRNDGTNYYGSHLRVVTNRGPRDVQLQLNGGPMSLVKGAVRQLMAGAKGGTGGVVLAPGARATFKHDLMEVSCP